LKKIISHKGAEHAKNYFSFIFSSATGVYPDFYRDASALKPSLRHSPPGTNFSRVCYRDGKKLLLEKMGRGKTQRD
jgi:hypothetical protein